MSPLQSGVRKSGWRDDKGLSDGRPAILENVVVINVMYQGSGTPEAGELAIPASGRLLAVKKWVGSWKDLAAVSKTADEGSIPSRPANIGAKCEG